MKIEIIKAESGKFCLHHACKKDERYVTIKGRIRKGSIAAKISHNTYGKWNSVVNFFYCRSCIDQLLLDCRINLDSKLWIFK